MQTQSVSITSDRLQFEVYSFAQKRSGIAFNSSQPASYYAFATANDTEVQISIGHGKRSDGTAIVLGLFGTCNLTSKI